jgi:DNA topoisomerase-1
MSVYQWQQVAGWRVAASNSLGGPCDPVGAGGPLGQNSGEHFNSALAAGLQYVSDEMPGIRRKRSGRGFSYYAPGGVLITEKQQIKRFRKLVIPPAWTDVWICPHLDGHLQVTARDARGRKQYRYHPTFRAARDGTKFERLFDFGEVIWKIREKVERDVLLDDLPREKVLATVVWLLERTLIRVGTQELARENKSYGLTTLRRRHVEIDGAELRFEFRGKSRVEHAVSVTDTHIARIVQRCQDLPGEILFKYLDDDGRRQDIEAEHVNEYLREAAGADVTAKDFRTWAGTMDCAEFLREFGPASTKREAEQNVVRAIDHTAKRLGNTRTVCRKYYIHPALIEAYLEGEMLPPPPKHSKHVARTPGGKLRKHEEQVLEFLKSRIQARAQAAAAAQATASAQATESALVRRTG